MQPIRFAVMMLGAFVTLAITQSAAAQPRPNRPLDRFDATRLCAVFSEREPWSVVEQEELRIGPCFAARVVDDARTLRLTPEDSGAVLVDMLIHERHGRGGVIEAEIEKEGETIIYAIVFGGGGFGVVAPAAPPTRTLMGLSESLRHTRPSRRPVRRH